PRRNALPVAPRISCWLRNTTMDTASPLVNPSVFLFRCELTKNFMVAGTWLLVACMSFGPPTDSVYAFSYFKGNGEDGLHLAYSYDGFSWKALNNDQSVLEPELSKDKLMRDPCIIRGGDGRFHMVWTVSWTDQGIGYAS